MESLRKIPENSPVFIDANIFIYHFCAGVEKNLGEACTEFFLKTLRDGNRTYTSTSIMAEVLHRALIYEATAKFHLDPRGVLNKLLKNSELTRELTKYHIIPVKVIEFGISILNVTIDTILSSESWRRKYGLMINDSLTAALMHKNEILNIATNDSDFDHIHEFTIWKPSL